MTLSARDYERMLDLAVALIDSDAPELDWPVLTAELNDISDRNRACALRVQPLLIAAERHVLRMRELHQALDSLDGPHCMGLRAADRGLTTRELAVLMLLAEGLIATAIGRRLGISPRTVTKHQENLYRKLEASDRLTAVLHAQQAGLLPTP